jgi:hypothetical protein
VTAAAAPIALFDVCVAAVGYLWVSGLGAADHRRPVSMVGFSFFVGWMVMGVCLAVAVALEVDPSVPQTLAIASLAAAAGWGLRFVGRSHGPRHVARERGRLQLVAHAGGALLAVAAVTQAAWAWKSGADSSWDVWAMWEAKGRALYFFHAFDSGVGGATSFAHPDYPPLVPATIAAQYHVMGGPYSGELPFQQALVSIGFLATLIATLRPRVPAWILYPCLAVLASAPRFWDRMQTVLPDQSVAYFVAVAAVVLVLWLDERRPMYLVLAGLALAAGALTKNEGLLLGVSLVSTVVLVAAFARIERPWIAATPLVGLVALVPWKLWLTRHGLSHVPTDYAWSDLLDWHQLTQDRARVAYAVPRMAGVLFDTTLWTWVVPLAVVAVIVAALGARVSAVAIAAWVGAVFLGQACIYWIGRLDVAYYVATSAERVIGTLPVVLGSLTPLLLALGASRRGSSAGRPYPVDEHARTS